MVQLINLFLFQMVIESTYFFASMKQYLCYFTECFSIIDS